MERVLRRLRERADRHADQAHRHRGAARRVGEDLRHLERPGGVGDEDEAGEQHETAGRRDEQGLEGSGASRRAGVLDADQQVRRDRGQLPRREHGDQVVGDDDAEHRSGEQREQAGEAVDAVAGGGAAVRGARAGAKYHHE